MHISEINIYPVKSLKGFSVESAVVEKRGLQHDRRWMLTNRDGMFFTQREFPKMALIDVKVNSDSLVLSAPETEPLLVSHGAKKDFVGGQKVTVWGAVCDALLYPSEVNEWLSDYLETDCQLVYMPDDSFRDISEKFNQGGEIVSFADGYPVLVIGEASLADLNARLAGAAGEPPRRRNGDTPPLEGGEFVKSVPMNRFRPNIVVSGSEAFAEDRWSRIRVGDAIFRGTKPCARCVMTTVDQTRGEFDGKDPLKTLSEYRMAKDAIPDIYESLGMNPTAVLFGQNLVGESISATIRVGDKVEVIS
jgi:uncharacterized protein